MGCTQTDMPCCACAVVPAVLCCCQFGDQEGVRGVFVAMLELLKQKVGESGLLTFRAVWSPTAVHLTITKCSAFDCAG